MKKISKILLSAVGLCCILGSKTMARDLNERNVIQENKRNINVELSDETLYDTYFVQGADASTIRKYNLADHIEIFTKNQGTSNNCWTMPVITVFETNRALKYGITEELSAKHMDYATSQSFIETQHNKYGYDREVNTGGNAEWGMAYFTSGVGPIYEICLPYDGNFDDLPMKKVIGRVVAAKVQDWIRFDGICKKMENGVLKYYSVNDNKTLGEEYSIDTVNEMRNKIKEHIMTNGAIATRTYLSELDKYFNSKTSAYYCDNPNVADDHGVAIIGWDDDYAIENFTEGHRPSTKGAYIVQNSWGKEDRVPERYYISYEDYRVEKELLGIINTSEKDNAETVYQYDYLAKNSGVAFPTGETYGANVFSRDSSEKEVLKEIGFSCLSEMNYEIYINASNGNINSSEMQLVAKSTSPVSKGYHTVTLDTPIQLTGNKFAIAIKYIGTDVSIIPMQLNNGSDYYSFVRSDYGQSYIGNSLDSMEDVMEMENMEDEEGNICIKAFTRKESSTFTIRKGDANLDGEITEEDLRLLRMHLTDLIRLTGYSFYAVDWNDSGTLSSVDYSIEQRVYMQLANIKREKGDINFDGVIDEQDVALLRMHLVGLITLEGDAFDSVDWNNSGTLSSVDLSIEMFKAKKKE